MHESWKRRTVKLFKKFCCLTTTLTGSKEPKSQASEKRWRAAVGRLESTKKCRKKQGWASRTNRPPGSGPRVPGYPYSQQLPHWQKVHLIPKLHHNYSLILKVSRYFQLIFCLVALLWTFHILQVQLTGFNYSAQHFTSQTKESDRHFLRGHLGNANQKSTIPCKKMGLSNLPNKLGRGCSASFLSKNNEIILSSC